MQSPAWNTVVGTIVVLVGIAVTLVPVWTFYTKEPKDLAPEELSDALKELIKKLPWVAMVGLLLIYAGLRTLGVEFP